MKRKRQGAEQSMEFTKMEFVKKLKGKLNRKKPSRNDENVIQLTILKFLQVEI